MKNKLLILSEFDYVLDSIKKSIPSILDSYEVISYSKEDEVSVLVNVANYIQENPENNRAIIIDDYGILPFMLTAKYEKVICAQLSEEHSSLMTRDHNNANIISVGAMMAGVGVIGSIIDRFINHEYSGGRHQIRIDMLDGMGGAK